MNREQIKQAMGEIRRGNYDQAVNILQSIAYGGSDISQEAWQAACAGQAKAPNGLKAVAEVVYEGCFEPDWKLRFLNGWEPWAAGAGDRLYMLDKESACVVVDQADLNCIARLSELRERHYIQLRQAVEKAAPWLSAGLDDKGVCEEAKAVFLMLLEQVAEPAWKTGVISTMEAFERERNEQPN